MSVMTQEKRANPESIKNPNVLFISLDDMNDWVEPLGGNNQSITPNLEQFAATGVNFTHNYTASPGFPSATTEIGAESGADYF